MVNLTLGWIKSGPFFPKLGHFFDCHEKGRVDLPPPSPLSYTPDMKDLNQNNGLVLLITK